MIINRKSFFKALAWGAVSLPFIMKGVGKGQGEQTGNSANLITKRKYRWKMTTTWPPNFPLLGDSTHLFARLVSEMSDGQLEIQVFAAGELVPALQSFDAVRSGAAQAGSGVAYYWAGKIPAAPLFTAVPFGMNAQQFNAWMEFGGGQQLWEQLYEPFGLVPMLAGNTGVQMGGWFNREINSISDFRGLKMRIPGLGGRVLKKAGGTPVLLAGSEIYLGLERGVIDAAEWIGPFHDYMMGFHRIARYYYGPGWQEPGPALELIFNKKAYEELPSNLKIILQTAAARINKSMLSEFETKNALYLNKLVEEQKVQVRFFSPEILRQLRGFSVAVLDEMAEKDAPTKKIIDSYRQFHLTLKNWSGLSEKEFYQNMQSYEG